MSILGVDNLFKLPWGKIGARIVTYGDVFHQQEVEMSAFNFEHAAVDKLRQYFNDYEDEAERLLALKLPLPAYEMVIKASHTFNLLDARHAISVTERQRYILRVRHLSRHVADAYYASREALGFPMQVPAHVE